VTAETRWLLDTNAISDIVRLPEGPVAIRALERREQCFTSLIVAAELEFGLVRRPSKQREESVRIVLASLPILGWDHPAERHYADIRAKLENAGTPIGSNDLFIAAHALALDATLVTASAREFCRVPGLKVENWAA
jgi:tRNA(fMet)-specific endonuclease VapC